MKKILIIFALLFFTNTCNAFEINEYLNKDYIGTPYEQAVNETKPYIMIFANPNDIFTITRMLPIGEMIYNEFKNDYNFCILNSKKNKDLVEFFNIKRFPQVFIIDTQKMHYTNIERKYYSKKNMRKILLKYKNGIPD